MGAVPLRKEKSETFLGGGASWLGKEKIDVRSAVS